MLSIDKVATGSYLEGMRSVGIKLLKNKLSEYIRLAAGGETVLVTDRDRVAGPEPIDFGCASARCRSPGVDQATAIGWNGNAGTKTGDETP